MATDRKGRLQEFADWAAAHIKGDEKLQFPRPIWERVRVRAIDRLFQAFGQKGLLEVGGTAEFRIRKAKEDGGGAPRLNTVDAAAYVGRTLQLAPSSSGLGHRPFTPATRVRVPLGSLILDGSAPSISAPWRVRSSEQS